MTVREQRPTGQAGVHLLCKEVKMRIRYESGQSILEYTLVLGAVIAVIVFVLLGNGKNSIKQKVQDAYTQSGDAISKTATDLTTGVFTGTSAN